MEEQKMMSEQPKGIYQAMAAIAAEIGAIGKDKMCTQGASFAYRGIDDVYNALNPIMAKHGVFVLPIAGERTTDQRQTKTGGIMEIVVMRMTYKFCHADGSYVEAVTVGQAMDSGDKATNKAMAIAHKYAILQAFCIPTEDMEDPDAVAEQLAPRQPQRQQYQQAPQQRQEQASQQQRPRQAQSAHPRQAHAENPNAMTSAQSKALMAHLTKKHGNNREAYLADLSAFFGREIKSSRELTKVDVQKYLDSVFKGENNAE